MLTTPGLKWPISPAETPRTFQASTASIVATVHVARVLPCLVSCWVERCRRVPMVLEIGAVPCLGVTRPADRSDGREAYTHPALTALCERARMLSYCANACAT